MWTRPLAIGVLVGSAALACGTRTDLLGLPGSASADSGTVPDGNETDDAGSTPDATATVDAAASVEGGATADGTDGATCKIPALALGVGVQSNVTCVAVTPVSG